MYGEQRILRDGVLPRDVVLRSPGWRDEATRLPEGVVRAPVMGFDLVRNEYGGWRVLEDNVRSPSGVAYAIAVRALMDDVMPDLPRPAGIAHPAVGYELLRSTLLAHAVPGHPRRTALQRPCLRGLVRAPPAGRRRGPRAGPARGRRHRRRDWWSTARPGFPSASSTSGWTGSSSTCATTPAGRSAPRSWTSPPNGGVVLANAPGNGVADDKSTYPFLPELITYYLGERPAIESVPTYRPGDEAERPAVLGRVGELVTKPVDGYGGAGVLIGPAATAAEVAARRAEIAANPAAGSPRRSSPSPRCRAWRPGSWSRGAST